MTQEELIEKLAEEDHEAWRLWLTLFLASGKALPDGSLALSREYSEALQKSAQTFYSELPDQAKANYHKRIDRILPIIEEYANPKEKGG